MENGNGECPRCNDPNGWPCTSCGYGVRERPAQTQAPEGEAKPDNSAIRRAEVKV